MMHVTVVYFDCSDRLHHSLLEHCKNCIAVTKAETETRRWFMGAACASTGAQFKSTSCTQSEF